MSDLVRERLRKFREKLLDLSKRNRLLNYRPLRAGTVRIVDELPAEVFRLLVSSSRGFEFVPVAEEEGAVESEDDGEAAADESPEPAGELGERDGDESTPLGPRARAADLSSLASFGPEGVGSTLDERDGHGDDGDDDGVLVASAQDRGPLATGEAPREEESREAVAAPDGEPRPSEESGTEEDGEASREAAASEAPDRDEAPPAAGNESATAALEASGESGESDPAGATSSEAEDGAGGPANGGDGRLFVPYSAEEVAGRHIDYRLQTDLSAARLDHNLLRISREAASSLEEQGFNTLFLSLGALEWHEPNAPEDRFLAPILLVPVELRRRSPRSPFLLFPSDDDPVLNPSLLMKIERELGVRLGDLPDDFLEWDLKQLLAEVDERVAKPTGWHVVNDIFLGLFSFTKFIMYRDLEASGEEYASNPLVAALCGAAPPPPEPSPDRALDEVFEPEATFQVLDADSTQQEAILAIRDGASLVIEGPPGTGKSQTITNVIAECLAAGKRVLFVSEKMAALEVVHARLGAAGLADFCLELHSRHASKRRVVEELGRTLGLGLEAEPEPDTKTLAAMREVRARLNEHVELLSSPVEPLGLSPWQAISRSVALDDHPEVAVTIENPMSWTRERLDEALRRLESLARAREEVRRSWPDITRHPWRGTALEELGYGESVEIREHIETLREAARETEERSREAAKKIGARAPATLALVRRLAERLELLAATPRPDPQSLAVSVWSGGADEVQRLIALVREYRDAKANLCERWSVGFLELDHGAEAAQIRRRQGFLRFFQPGWWSLRGRLRDVLREGASMPARARILTDLELAARAREARDELRGRSERGALLFGARWQGERSDPGELETYAEWMRKFAAHIEAGDERLVELAARGVEEPENTRRDAASLREAAERFARDAEALLSKAKLDPEVAFGAALERIDLETLAGRLAEMREHLESLHDYGRLVRAERECKEVGLGAFLLRATNAASPEDELAPSFERLFLRLWLDQVFEARPALRRFRRQDYEQSIRDFRELDLEQLRLARRRLRKRLLDSLPDGAWEASAKSELGILQREIRRKRGHKPIRKLFQEIPNALLRLKPCCLMSPLSVAQFLDPHAIRFDVVIFDEASQISPEDAIGAIARGTQVVVVGDSRQLPPTTFFQRQEIADAPLDVEEEDETPDLESILDECVVAGFPRQMLRWHYRSRHESLITFSNRHFYESRLHTFPSASEARGELGVDLVLVDDGVFDRARSRANAVEADRVAAAVLAHFREHPQLSLGVGTFSQAQQVAILDRLEELRRKDESLEEFFTADRDEGFFVKNLENIQGDERDVIFLSVGYGRDHAGKLHLNFGPLNKAGGERRLNVLVTRARRRLTVFSSIRASDIDENRVTGAGARLLKRYLEYAELGARGPLPQASGAKDTAEDPWARGVENAIAARLRALGHEVECGIGHSDHRISVAVRDSSANASFILGIDTDGPAWQHQRTARDRERLRQQVLEGLGWRIHHVWSSEWLRNPRAEAERIAELVRSAREGELEPEVLPLLDAIAKKPAPRRRTRPRRGTSVEELVRPYTIAELKPGGDAESFGSSPRDVLSRLVATVRAEAPIHRDEATRRVASCWGISRTTRAVEDVVNAAIESACETEKIRADEEGFLWLPGEADDLVPRTREAADAPRDGELIALEELTALAALVLARELRLPREDLAARTGRLLGFQRTRGKLKERILAAIDRLVAEGRATESEAGLEPARG